MHTSRPRFEVVDRVRVRGVGPQRGAGQDDRVVGSAAEVDGDGRVVLARDRDLTVERGLRTHPLPAAVNLVPLVELVGGDDGTPALAGRHLAGQCLACQTAQHAARSHHVLRLDVRRAEGLGVEAGTLQDATLHVGRDEGSHATTELQLVEHDFFGGEVDLLVVEPIQEILHGRPAVDDHLAQFRSAEQIHRNLLLLLSWLRNVLR